MSTKAYRVINIETAPEATFNLWRDEELMAFIEAKTDFYNHDGLGLPELSVADLKKALKIKGLDPETAKSLQEDIQWAEDNGQEFVAYECY